ncbi:MAG: YHYH protein [Proteobacteria bacterium]|nr:YHYH protein [Pseudomonadota bacterium]
MRQLALALAAPEVEGYCQGTNLVVTSNSIPHYTFVAITPNALTEVDQNWSIPLNPTLAASPSEIPLLGQIAFTVSGLPIFGPNEATQPDPYGDPVYNGIVDGCGGHTAMEYHNHKVEQKCMTADAMVGEPWTLADPDGTEASPVVAWSFDGFAIYGPYGCLDADCSEIVEYVSGYEQIADPSTYAWDAHEYRASDDPTVLDECNGHEGPDGDYHYHATETFPYVLGCYSGSRIGG